MNSIKVLTNEQLLELPDLYQTEGTNPLCQIKLFTPDSHFSWFIIEFSHEDKDTCFGLVNGYETELGYFSLKELSNIKSPFGLDIEVDTSFEAIPLSLLRKSIS